MVLNSSTERKIQALLRLLTDPNPKVASTIQQELVSLGEVVLPFLDHSEFATQGLEARVEEIREDIRFSTIRRELEQLLTDEQQLNLESGTFLIARSAYPNLDVESYVRKLDDLAEEVRPRIHPTLPPEDASQILCEYLFQEKGFCGNRDQYYDPENSFFNRVLDRRTGIPITLCVLYLFISGRIGIPCVGVGMPGHFVVGIEDTDPALFIDCFNGGVFLQARDCEQFLTDAGVGFDESFLSRTPNDLILARMIRNLVSIFEKQDESKQVERLNSLIITLEHVPKLE